MYKKTVCLDFDGVIHSYISGWLPDVTELVDPPVEGAFKFIETLLEAGYDVAVHSSRSHKEGGIEAMKKWFLKHGMEEEIFNQINFPAFKPPAILYIDDRGYQFDGKFPTVEYIDEFKPWYKD